MPNQEERKELLNELSEFSYLQLEAEEWYEQYEYDIYPDELVYAKEAHWEEGIDWTEYEEYHSFNVGYGGCTVEEERAGEAYWSSSANK